MNTKEDKVLVIDDNAVIRKLASNLLEKKGYAVITAENGTSGITLAKSQLPKVILLDLMMPEMDGYEVCRQLKAFDDTKDIPIIMVTSRSDSLDKIKGLELGAADYVPKPFDYGELQARVQTQIKMKNLWDELQEKNKYLEDLIKKDGLTNLYNHRHFHERISEEFSRSKRYTVPLSCVLIDIDHFKNVNDRYGHQAGDEILKTLARMLKHNIRDCDFAARYGGEEFSLILPHTVLEKASALCERIRGNVESSQFQFNDKKIGITISLGVAGVPDNTPVSYSELIRFADEALYNAKEDGRNKVRIFTKK